MVMRIVNLVVALIVRYICRELEATIRQLAEDKHVLNNTLHAYKQKLVKYQEEVIESNAMLADLNIHYAQTMNHRVHHVTYGGGRPTGEREPGSSGVEDDFVEFH